MVQPLLRRGILIASLLIAALFTQAQTEKGRLMVSGSFSRAGVSISENASALQFNFRPSVGKFVANNLAVGTRMGFGYSMYNVRTPINPGRSKAFSFETALFTRYYVPLKGNVRPFVELEAGQQFTTFNSNGFKGSQQLLYAQAMGGASFFFAKNASLDVAMGYRVSRDANLSMPNTTQGSFQSNVGLSLYLDWKNKKRE
jgi:hypothetical protein